MTLHAKKPKKIVSTDKEMPVAVPSPISNDVIYWIDKKIIFFGDIIQKTMIHVQKNKMLDILGINEVTSCLHSLQELNSKLEIIRKKNNKNSEETIVQLQTINNEISALFKLYGTEDLHDFLCVCFSNTYEDLLDDPIKKEKMRLLQNYFHPTGYKVLHYKAVDKTSGSASASVLQDISAAFLLDEKHLEKSNHLDCFDIFSTSKKFHVKVYGIKLFISCASTKKSMLVYGVVDDVIVSFLHNKYITQKNTAIRINAPKENDFECESFEKFILSMSLKDYLIYEPFDVYNKYMGCLHQIQIMKQKTLATSVKEFIQSDLFNKRSLIMHLLIKSSDYENQYLAYLLYDLLSNDVNDHVDTLEQTILFDSFPWSIKQNFKDAMKKTIQYTMEMVQFDVNKIPLEQQICLLKVNDQVKEKAMMKWKEVKAKSEDSGSKARQYLDGLLKIPFQIYKKEPIMYLMQDMQKQCKDIISKGVLQQCKKTKNTGLGSLELIYFLRQGKMELSLPREKIIAAIQKWDKNKVQILLNELQHYSLQKGDPYEWSHMLTDVEKRKKQQSIDIIDSVLQMSSKKKDVYFDMVALFAKTNPADVDPFLYPYYQQMTNMGQGLEKIKTYIGDVRKILDTAIHGHEKAKRQLERIVGQWIHGQQDGYCFGFEGPPGVGKTSLAKRGLSDCLKDENGESRPFAMIQMGGDSNGSTLHGHNYTYVGSTWGNIVQILMDKKCMNPIIFIDELDKISRTEHGKEIVGILTHLLDPTQNDCFQDKYFNGVDLNLSKALFILSYNDVTAVDKILLDRIHRIQFQSLSLEDKWVIAETHILPEVYKKMGLEGMIHISEEVVKYIIEEYTMEAGVRKLKECLFEIVAEINLDMLKNNFLMDVVYPLCITKHDIKTKYLKERREMRLKKIHEENEVGVINCLWANDMGHGGILSAHAKFVPSDKFMDLRLTGLLDDMMRESFQISLTLAYDLTSQETIVALRDKYDALHKYGIHMHMGDGSIPKSGTSAGIAIALLFYSLLNNKKIRHDFAVTGEAADLKGSSGEIGALKTKIIYGIKAGVRHFIYPEENAKDFEDFFEKYGGTDLVKGISFTAIKNIKEAIYIIMED